MPGTSTVKAAVAASRVGGQCGFHHEGSRGFCGAPGRPSPLTLALLTLSLSVPPVPSASCPGRNCSCMRLSSTVGRSSLCVRSAATGRRAETACRCTSRPSTGGVARLPQGLAPLLPPGPRAAWEGRVCCRSPRVPPTLSLVPVAFLGGDACGMSKPAGPWRLRGRGFQARPGSPTPALGSFSVSRGSRDGARAPLPALPKPFLHQAARSSPACSQGSGRLASALPVSVARAGLCSQLQWRQGGRFPR